MNNNNPLSNHIVIVHIRGMDSALVDHSNNGNFIERSVPSIRIAGKVCSEPANQQPLVKCIITLYNIMRLIAHFLGELISFGFDILDCASHVESRFRERVVCAGEDLLEGADCVLEWHELAFITCENLGNREGL